MGIEKRDKSIEQMFKDVKINAIPMQYVEKIIVGLADGEDIVYTYKDIEGVLSIEDLIAELPAELDVVDVGIRIAYHKIENDVKEKVKELLDKHKDDKDKGKE